LQQMRRPADQAASSKLRPTDRLPRVRKRRMRKKEVFSRSFLFPHLKHEHYVPNFPKPLGYSRCHCGRCSQRLMNANEIVVHQEQRDRVSAREPTLRSLSDAHSTIRALPPSLSIGARGPSVTPTLPSILAP